jgi:hypothetical protein
MARHVTQAILQSSRGTHLRYISTYAAYLMVEEGTAQEMDDTETGQMVFRLRGKRGTAGWVPTSHVIATITRGDMERNAAAVVEHKECRSRSKVRAWPLVHDTFAVTVVDGKVFIPDAKEAQKRVKAMRKRTKCSN